MKKILVPTDFSVYAGGALRVAIEIAKKSGGEVHLLHIFYSPVNWMGVPLEEDRLFPEIKAVIANEKKRLAESLQKVESLGVKAEAHFHVNDDTGDLLKYAEELNIDLIVMGAHGLSKLSERLMGSTARKVVRLAKCPVITCGTDMKEFNPGKIVITSDFSEKSIESYLPVFGLASFFKSSIHVVWVDVNYMQKENDIFVGKLKEALQDKYREIERLEILHQENIEEAVLQYVEEKQAGLIAMATHGRTGISRLVMGSLSENMVSQSKIPVMTVHL